MQPKNSLFALSAITLALSSYAYAETIKLDEVTVTASIANASLNNGYGAYGTNSVTGLPMTLRETPQSVSVISAQQMKDQNLRTVENAVKQATGVAMRTYGSSKTGYNFIYARGNLVTNFSLDGIPFSVGNYKSRSGKMGGDAFLNGNSTLYDRLEVVRGASALMNGTGEPSATVSLIRKRPTKEFQGEVRLSGGSWKNYGASSDLSGRLNSDGTLRGRFVAATQGGKSYVPRISDRANSFYGVTEWDITPHTMLTLGVSYEDNQEKGSSMHSFTTFDNEGYRTRFDRGVNAASTWSYGRSRQLNVFTEIKHRFNKNWETNLEYGYLHGKWDQLYGIPGVGSVDHLTGKPNDAVLGKADEQPRQHTFGGTLNGHFDLAGRQHDVMFGFNSFYLRNDSPDFARASSKVANVYDYAKTGEIPFPQFKHTGQSIQRAHQSGVYAATRLRATDKLSVIAGARYSRFHWINLNAREKDNVTAGRLTPYTGLVYDFSDNFSGYASYSYLFKPQAEKQQNGTFVKPMQGTHTELGVKGEFFDGRLNTSLAVFESRKQNDVEEAGKHADNTSYYRNIDGVKVRGWEAEISGKVNDHWLIQGGVSQSVAKDNQGERKEIDLPRTQFKLFTSYQIKQWTFGGGVRWQSKTIGTAESGLSKNATAAAKARSLANATQSSYLLADLMVRFQFNKHADFTLNIENLLNKNYRTRPDAHSYGAPFNMTGTFSYKF